MTVSGESFWSVVYEPFMSRDLTRQDLRAVIGRGLEQTRGSYKLLVQLFNLQPDDYKRLLSFLRKYECQLPFQKFRSLPIRGGLVNKPDRKWYRIEIRRNLAQQPKSSGKADNERR